jgi:hypothetical protein
MEQDHLAQLRLALAALFTVATILKSNAADITYSLRLADELIIAAKL